MTTPKSRTELTAAGNDAFGTLVEALSDLRNACTAMLDLEYAAVSDDNPDAAALRLEIHCKKDALRLVCNDAQSAIEQVSRAALLTGSPLNADNIDLSRGAAQATRASAFHTARREAIFARSKSR